MNYCDELKCPLCKIEYNEGENLPLLLINCGHTICSKCINTLLSENQNSFICQEDGTKYEGVSISSFPKNITLIKLIQKTNPIVSSPKLTSKSTLMESLKKATTRSQKKTLNVCPLHQNRNLEIICMDDRCKICTNCALFGNHKNHNIMNIEDFEKDIEMKSELLIDLFDLIDQNFKKETFDTKLNTSNLKIDNLSNTINQKYSEISAKVSAFSNELINKVKNEEKNLLENIYQKFAFLKEKITFYKSLPNDLIKKVEEWRKGVQTKLDILNDITDIDEQCIQLIDTNDNNSYNYLLEQGETLMNELEKVNSVPIEDVEKEVSNVNIQIKTNVLEQDLFTLENNIDFTKIIKKVGMLSTAGKTLTNSHSISYFKEEDNISQFPTISDIKFPEEFDLGDNNETHNRKFTNGNSLLSYENTTSKLGKINLSNSFLNLSDDNIVNEHKTINQKKKTKSTILDFECLPLNNLDQAKNKKNKKLTPPNTSRTKTPEKDKIMFIKNQFKKEQVNLSRYDIGDEGAKIVAEYIANSKIKIKELKLTKCNITDVGASYIFKALESCNSIVSFNIGGNLLSNKSVDAITNMLQKNTSIKTVYFTNNDFTLQMKEKIKSYNGSNGLKGIKIFI